MTVDKIYQLISQNILKTIQNTNWRRATLYIQGDDTYVDTTSSLLWENYRSRYSWSPNVISQNKKIRLFNINIDYYNVERETMLRAWVESSETKERAIPKEITFFSGNGRSRGF